MEQHPVPQARVSADAWTDGDWPLTIDSGILVCIGGAALTGLEGVKGVFIIDAKERVWPLNGIASGWGTRVASLLPGSKIHLHWNLSGEKTN